MNVKIEVILNVCIYLALIPIVYRTLMAIDFNKIFRKNYDKEIRLLYFLITLAVSKLVGDLFIDIMGLIRVLFDVK